MRQSLEMAIWRLGENTEGIRDPIFGGAHSPVTQKQEKGL